MNVGEFIDALKKVNPNAEIETGNSVYFITKFMDRNDTLNYYYGFSNEELKKDLSKINRVIIWGDE